MTPDKQTDGLDVHEVAKWNIWWTILGILFVDFVVISALYVWWTMP